MRVDDARDVVGAVDGLAVDLGDDVTGVDAGALGRPAGGDRRDLGAGRRVGVGRVGGLDAEVGARDLVAAFSSRGTTSRTVFDGTAKPMPTLPCELPAVAICELTPMTRPVSSSSGPPELPGLIGASVWMTWSIEKPLGALIERPMPETMPSVAVRSRPKGLPMAIAVSPTWTWRESANCSGLALRGALPESIFTTARSLDGIRALDLAVDAAPVGAELDDDAVGVADDVRVGHERAVAVDEEAGARARRRCGSRRRRGWPGRRSCPAGDRLALVGRDRLAGDGRQRRDVGVVVQQRAGGEGAARDRPRRRAPRPRPSSAGWCVAARRLARPPPRARARRPRARWRRRAASSSAASRACSDSRRHSPVHRCRGNFIAIGL